MDRQDISDKVKNLIHSAMEGFLTPELLSSCWDLSWNSDEYLMNIYDNLEISVDHIPGYFLKEGVDFKKWQCSFEYKILEIDFSLIQQYESLSSLQLVYRREKQIRKL